VNEQEILKPPAQTVYKFPLTTFVAHVHAMLLNIYLTSRRLLLPKPYRSISCIHLSTFPWRPLPWEQSLISPLRVGGRTHEQIFLVQKLEWLALKQCFLARKKAYTRVNKTCVGNIARLYVALTLLLNVFATTHDQYI
jgi:hypothetical protein